MKTNRTLRIVFAIMLVVLLATVMLEAAGAKAPEEEFETIKSRTNRFENEASNEAVKILKDKFIILLTEEGIKVSDSVLEAAPAGTGDYMGLVILTDSNKVFRYEVAGNGWTDSEESIEVLDALVNGLYSDDSIVEYAKNLKFKLEGDKFVPITNK